MNFWCKIWLDDFQTTGAVILEMASSWKELTVSDISKQKIKTLRLILHNKRLKPQDWILRWCMYSYSSPSFCLGCSSTSYSFSSSYWLSGNKSIICPLIGFSNLSHWNTGKLEMEENQMMFSFGEFKSQYSCQFNWSIAIQFKWYLTPAVATGPISVLGLLRFTSVTQLKKLNLFWISNRNISGDWAIYLRQYI